MNAKQFLLAGLLVVLLGCNRDFSPLIAPSRQGEQPVQSAVLSADQDFGFELLRRLLADSPGDNLVLSPFSVSAALTMLLNGADGETFSSLQNALGFTGLELDEINQAYQAIVRSLAEADSGVTISVANSFWYREGEPVRSTYVDRCRQVFGAEIFPIDFALPNALETINHWVEQKTEGLIPEILDRIDPGMVALLLNALYFDGEWLKPFDPQNTRPDTFYLENGNTVTCDMMYRFDLFRVGETEDGKWLQNYFENGDYSCLFYLPKSGLAEQTVLQRMSSLWLQKQLSQLSPQFIEVYLPVFHISSGKDLRQILAEMGLGNLFTPAADFSRMMAGGGVWVSRVVHKADFDCNESGITASAATAVTMVRGIPHRMIKFNRPFYFFLIHDDNQTLLFAGRVVDPTKQN